MPGETSYRLFLIASMTFLISENSIVLCVPAFAKAASGSTTKQSQKHDAQAKQSQQPKQSAQSKPSAKSKPMDWGDLLKGVAPQAVKHYHTGRAQLTRENFDKALIEFDEALKIDKKTPVHESRARCYAEAGRYKEAADDLKVAIAQIPTSPRYKFLGEVYSAQNLDAPAIEAFTAGIKMDPGDFWCYKDRGDIYLRQKKYKEAISDYTKLIELAPKEPIGYNCRVRAYKASGRQDLADKDLKKVRGLMDAEALF